MEGHGNVDRESTLCAFNMQLEHIRNRLVQPHVDLFEDERLALRLLKRDLKQGIRRLTTARVQPAPLGDSQRAPLQSVPSTNPPRPFSGRAPTAQRDDGPGDHSSSLFVSPGLHDLDHTTSHVLPLFAAPNTNAVGSDLKGRRRQDSKKRDRDDRGTEMVAQDTSTSKTPYGPTTKRTKRLKRHSEGEDDEDVEDDDKHQNAEQLAFIKTEPREFSWNYNSPVGPKKCDYQNCAACNTICIEVGAAASDCKHDYFQDCIENMFRLAVADDAAYPPS
ncbi:Chromatin structure-remodeling complex subunit sfh1 [Sphaceloma murrayae]|uniref:Chromatin structure-remodeling complex subunit sfh1 n=1 Tax=Sphaceloma murrayae TaxID=2082308 RepID=A0A2K1QKI0_9PEZI|nr:Chromatin structure-remodeling complex subunit sfh1 [Sphaceloma murrayae]